MPQASCSSSHITVHPHSFLFSLHFHFCLILSAQHSPLSTPPTFPLTPFTTSFTPSPLLLLASVPPNTPNHCCPHQSSFSSSPCLIPTYLHYQCHQYPPHCHCLKMCTKNICSPGKLSCLATSINRSGSLLHFTFDLSICTFAYLVHSDFFLVLDLAMPLCHMPSAPFAIHFDPHPHS
jgi:hypothetical protein